MRMDIRVSAYNPVTVSTITRSGSPFATAYVQNAAQSSPVTPVEATRPVQNAVQSSIAANPNDGYTDSVRGSLINILA